jgi:hypothetical protein
LREHHDFPAVELFAHHFAVRIAHIDGAGLICSPKLDGLYGEMTACLKNRQKRLVEFEPPAYVFLGTLQEPVEPYMIAAR